MKPFRFRLTTLLRLREATRDERRVELATALHAEERLLEHRAEVQQELANLRQQFIDAGVGRIDIDHLLGLQRYEAIVQLDLKTIEEHMRTIATEVDRRRAALVAADREVHVLEKLRETQAQRHRDDQARLDIKQLDEIAQLVLPREDRA